MIDEKKDIFSGSAMATPARGLKGEIRVPGDKSISHRAVIIGSVARGTTEVEGFLGGEDNVSTVNAFRDMGVRIEQTGASTIVVRGNGMRSLKEPEDVIDAGNSGTTTRLLMGLLAAQPFFSVLTGDASLRRRPMKRVVDPLVLMGASIHGRKGGSLLPVAISGRGLKGISYATPVASAQLKSAILLAGIYAEGETTVVERDRSRDHTERMLKLFGAEVRVDGNAVTVRSTKELNGCKIRVPGDISSAAFMMVGALITQDSELLIRDVGVNPARTGIIRILRRMGGVIEALNEREVCGEPVADLVVRSSRLMGVDIDGAELLHAIDEFPVLCVAAAFAQGATTITGAAELRVKESDRIAVMASSLNAVGVRSVEKEDGIVIEGSRSEIEGGAIESFGDHRIAMSMAIAALRSRSGVEIRGARSVDVSYPGFFSELERAKAG